MWHGDEIKSIDSVAYEAYSVYLTFHVSDLQKRKEQNGPVFSRLLLR